MPVTRWLFALLRWIDSLRAEDRIDVSRFHGSSPRAMRELLKHAKGQR